MKRYSLVITTFVVLASSVITLFPSTANAWSTGQSAALCNTGALPSFISDIKMRISDFDMTTDQWVAFGRLDSTGALTSIEVDTPHDKGADQYQWVTASDVGVDPYVGGYPALAYGLKVQHPSWQLHYSVTGTYSYNAYATNSYEYQLYDNLPSDTCLYAYHGITNKSASFVSAYGSSTTVTGEYSAQPPTVFDQFEKCVIFDIGCLTRNVIFFFTHIPQIVTELFVPQTSYKTITDDLGSRFNQKLGFVSFLPDFILRMFGALIPAADQSPSCMQNGALGRPVACTLEVGPILGGTMQIDFGLAENNFYSFFVLARSAICGFVFIAFTLGIYKKYLEIIKR